MNVEEASAGICINEAAEIWSYFSAILIKTKNIELHCIWAIKNVLQTFAIRGVSSADRLAFDFVGILSAIQKLSL